MENCISACQNCKNIIGENHPCWESCYDCEKVCIFIIDSKINNKYLKNQQLKLCMDACRICIIQCSKYRKIHKECLDCYNACIECNQFLSTSLITQ
jgi:hypothetical protein